MRVRLVLLATLACVAAAADKIRLFAYNGDGASPGSLISTLEASPWASRLSIKRGYPEDITSLNSTGLLENFDVLMFPGGSGSGQSRSLGDEGRVRALSRPLNPRLVLILLTDRKIDRDAEQVIVREYVERGGSYLGICGGAVLLEALALDVRQLGGKVVGGASGGRKLGRCWAR